VLMKRIVVEIEDEHMGGSTDENQEWRGVWNCDWAWKEQGAPCLEV
jgi:hypothetical protein